MAASWERCLERWMKAGLIATTTADRIRAYEMDQDKTQRLKWPAAMAIACGGLLLAAGILLFVAAHWDRLSPTERFALILALAAGMHIAGSIAAARFGVLSTALHAVGTACLGAGIFLTGQIFHLQEHWPAGMMLWALGAWVAWALLRDWPQAALAAMLTPAWLAGEWFEVAQNWVGSGVVLSAGLLMVAVTYLTALAPERATPVRKALSWIGGLALIPAVILLTRAGMLYHWWHRVSLPPSYQYVGWAAAFGLPLLVAWWFRGRDVWLNVIAALWVAALSATRLRLRADRHVPIDMAYELVMFALCALGSVGLMAWGMKEGRKERVNLGIAGFGLTLLCFYFSTIMDKLGRSASLIGLGLLFLLGGWALEKTRRRLLTQMGKGTI